MDGAGPAGARGPPRALPCAAAPDRSGRAAAVAAAAAAPRGARAACGGAVYGTDGGAVGTARPHDDRRRGRAASSRASRRAAGISVNFASTHATAKAPAARRRAEAVDERARGATGATSAARSACPRPSSRVRHAPASWPAVGAARAERDRERRGAPRALLRPPRRRRRRGLEPGEATEAAARRGGSRGARSSRSRSRGAASARRARGWAPSSPPRAPSSRRAARARAARRRSSARRRGALAPASAARAAAARAVVDVVVENAATGRRGGGRGWRAFFYRGGLVSPFFYCGVWASRELAALAVLREATQYSDLLLSYKLAGLALCG